MFSQIQQAILPFTMIGVVLWVYGLYRVSADQGFWSEESKQRFLWLFFVAILIGNDGYLLGAGIRVLNEVVMNVNRMALEASFNGVSNRDNIRNAQLNIQLGIIAGNLSQSCLKKTTDEEKSACLASIQSKALAQLKKQNANLLNQTWKGGSALAKNALEVTVLAGPNLGAMSLWMTVSNAFLVISRVALLVWASSAPLWVAITLFPMNSRGINIFLMGFWSVGMIIVSYTLIHGFLAFLMATNIGLTPTMFAFLAGCLAPIGAVLIAAGSAVGLMVGLSGGVVKGLQLTGSAVGGGKA
ncbi:hypothetical protein [Lyngbya confervoides]|uniref:Uncharacterized protein n=1 Tax=Lyngbya confervoides BDU141951 TaxID=1574623 RepID=A0ABD4T9I3_9CYAN|nr:hypothetical protein [Lyngbya confervoides]MCM1985099.1 hypothetical protein [Lyngbya confervoides BDU141951]